MNVLDAYARWMRLRGLSPNTARQRLACLDRMCRATGILDPTQVRAVDLAAWQQGWRLSAQSHSTYISHLAAFFAWALESGHVDADPTRVLVRPKLPRRLPRPIPEDRLMEALTAAQGRVRAYLALAAYAGMRACEIAELRREDVHDDAPVPVVVVMGKGRKERIVPLAPQLGTELRLVGLPPRGYVFGRYGDPARHIGASTVSNAANEHLHGLGYTETLHTLRHRFASRCYQISLDIRLTQELMGHSSPATTAGYAAFSPDAAAAVVNRLGVA